MPDLNHDQYPKGHPCRGCTYVLEISVPSCMFPQTEEKCFMQRQKESRVKVVNPNHKERMEVAKKIFKFIEVLKCVKKRKSYE
jgi:hypothetical protein